MTKRRQTGQKPRRRPSSRARSRPRWRSRMPLFGFWTSSPTRGSPSARSSGGRRRARHLLRLFRLQGRPRPHLRSPAHQGAAAGAAPPPYRAGGAAARRKPWRGHRQPVGDDRPRPRSGRSISCWSDRSPISNTISPPTSCSSRMAKAGGGRSRLARGCRSGAARAPCLHSDLRDDGARIDAHRRQDRHRTAAARAVRCGAGVPRAARRSRLNLKRGSCRRC